MSYITFTSFYGKIRFSITKRQYDLLRNLTSIFYDIPEYNQLRREIELIKINYPKELLKINNIVDEIAYIRKIVNRKDKKYPSISKFLLNNINYLQYWNTNQIHNLYNLINNINYPNIRNNVVYIDFLNFLKMSIVKKSQIHQKLEKSDFFNINNTDLLSDLDNTNKSNNDNIFELYNKENYTQEEIEFTSKFLN